MQIETTVHGVKVPKTVIAEMLSIISEIGKISAIDDLQFMDLKVARDGEIYTFDSLDEWYGEYRPAGGSARLYVKAPESRRSVWFSTSGGAYPSVNMLVEGESRSEAARLMQPFKDTASDPTYRVQMPDSIDPPPNVRVFLGHGRSADWLILKSELQDKHKIAVEAYESGSRAGHTIKDVLESMLDQSTMAFLIMTGEDFLADGGVRARQNVVHEAGLFQGKLGFARAIAVVEDGVEVFSNLDGVQQIRFEKGHVKSAVSEMLATIKREFPSS